MTPKNAATKVRERRFGQLSIKRPTQAYLDFAQGMKTNVDRATVPAVFEEYSRREVEFEREHGRKPANRQDVQSFMDSNVIWSFYEFGFAQSQRMMWAGVVDATEDNIDHIRSELAPSPADVGGSLRVDPDLELPSYYSEVEFHLRPGGMWNGEAQGYYTDIANDVYFSGGNTSRKAQQLAADGLPKRDYKSILDLACGIGQSTLPLARRFPNAEIHGIDLSAPLVTFAHKWSEDSGLAVHYAQENAEHTHFSDESFDLVYSFLLFHEIPDRVALNVIAEGFRLLEPGGVFAIADVRPYSQMEPMRAFMSDFMTYGNGEAYWREHCSRDYLALLPAAGFRAVQQPYSETSRSQFVNTASAGATWTLYLAEKPA